VQSFFFTVFLYHDFFFCFVEKLILFILFRPFHPSGVQKFGPLQTSINKNVFNDYNNISVFLNVNVFISQNLLFLYSLNCCGSLEDESLHVHVIRCHDPSDNRHDFHRNRHSADNPV